MSPRTATVPSRLASSAAVSSFPVPRLPATNPHDLIQPCTTSARQLRIFTLGQFRVVLPGGPEDREVVWKGPQSRLLLKSLIAAPGHQLSLDQAIEIICPDSDPTWSRKRLRDVLSKLRLALEPDERAYSRSTYVHSDRESLSLIVNRNSQQGEGMWLDGAAFEWLGEIALDHLERSEEGRSAGEAALALYHGPFLPIDRYSDWAQHTRQRYMRLWIKLLRRFAYTELAGQRYSQAILFLDRLLDGVPDDQDAMYLSMIAHVADGQRGEALRLYQAFSYRLAAEYGDTHMPDLHALYEMVRSGASKERLLTLLVSDTAGLPKPGRKVLI